MKRVTLAFLGALILGMVAGMAQAGTQDGAIVALHVKSHAASQPIICPGHVNVKTGLPDSVDPNTKGIPCSQYVTGWDLGVDVKADVYLVIARAEVAPGIAGLSCGIQYDANILVNAWNLCSDLQFPNGSWPASGGGMRLTWAGQTNCQDDLIPGFESEGVHAIAGAFYVYLYSPGGDLWLTSNNNLQSGPEFTVADCGASESMAVNEEPRISFSETGNLGCNPCVDSCPAVPVERTTWGKIKASHE